MTDISKLEIARRLLGTALDLYLKDSDPVSVHCLAGAAVELVENFANGSCGRSFSHQILAGNPGLDIRELHRTQREYYNAFKHATSRSGKVREDDELLASFSDARNDLQLFVGWYDYDVAGQLLPIEAQMFMAFWFCKYGDKYLRPERLAGYRIIFAQMDRRDRSKQKQFLTTMIDRARSTTKTATAATTDQRPLMLPWPPKPKIGA